MDRDLPKVTQQAVRCPEQRRVLHGVPDTSPRRCLEILLPQHQIPKTHSSAPGEACEQAQGADRRQGWSQQMAELPGCKPPVQSP